MLTLHAAFVKWLLATSLALCQPAEHPAQRPMRTVADLDIIATYQHQACVPPRTFTRWSVNARHGEHAER